MIIKNWLRRVPRALPLTTPFSTKNMASVVESSSSPPTTSSKSPPTLALVSPLSFVHHLLHGTLCTALADVFQACVSGRSLAKRLVSNTSASRRRREPLLVPPPPSLDTLSLINLIYQQQVAHLTLSLPLGELEHLCLSASLDAIERTLRIVPDKDLLHAVLVLRKTQGRKHHL